MRASLIAALAAAGAFTPQGAHAQTSSSSAPRSSATINVRIYATDGQPITTSADVTLSSESDAINPQRITIDNGVARFSGLVPGTYDITVAIPGFKDGVGQISTMAFGAVEASITMVPAEDPANTVGAKGMYLGPKAQKELELGKAAEKQKDYDKAEEHFLEAYKLAPGDPQVNEALGVLYLLKKDLPKSQGYLLRAASIQADNPDIQIDLGQLRIAQLDFKNAEQPLETAVKLAPKNFVAHWLLGVAYLDSKEYEKARDEAAMAVKLKDGAVSQAEYLLGQALAALGRNTEAIAALQAFVHGFPNDPYAPPANQLIAKLQAPPVAAAQTPATPAP